MGRAFEFRKGRKMKRWAQMAKTFTKIGKEITMSAKEGGGNPEHNIRLRMAIQNAKAASVPKENIERAIKKATDKDTSDYKEVNFEGYGAYGVAFFVECATDNNTRTVANVRMHFSHNGGSLGTSGSVEFLFERKCHFKIEKGENDIEELELELIDFGIEEIFEEEEHIMIYGEFTEFGNIQKGLDTLKLEIVESGYERIPMNTISLSEEQTEEIEKLIEKLEEDEDVQNVYHTMG